MATLGNITTATVENGTNNITVNRPADATEGQKVLAVVATNNGDPGAITTPSGWTLIDQESSGPGNTTDVGIWVFERIVQASPPASYTFTSVVTNPKAAAIVTLLNASLSAISSVEPSSFSGSQTTLAVGPVSTTLANGQYIVFTVQRWTTSQNATIPSYTEFLDIQPTTAIRLHGLNLAAASAGSSGAVTITWAGTIFDSAAIMVAVDDLPPAPTLTSIDRATGYVVGGTTVTLTGTDFVSGATVEFGGSAATNVTFVSSTTIRCTAPAHAAGAVDVVITNPDTQSDTLAGAFTYEDVPANDFLTDLVAYWTMDQSSGDMLDEVGANDLGLFQNAGYRANGILTRGLDLTDGGAIAHALHASDPALQFGDTDWTVCGWFNFSSAASNKGLVGKNQEILIQIQGTSRRVQAFVYDGVSTAVVSLTQTTAVATGVWHFFAVTYNAASNTATLYVDALTAVTGNPSAAPGVTADNFIVGDFNTTTVAAHSMDEIGKWSRVLDADEIAALYNSGGGFPYAGFGSLPADGGAGGSAAARLLLLLR